MKEKIFTTEFAGRLVTVEFSPLAQQAHASCTVKYGETVALVTVVYGEKDKEGVDFVPLTVEYEEKYYAAGKIYGSRFVRRETRPTETAILTARLIDRSIRPLFDKQLRRDVQVVVTIFSIGDDDPDWVALLGASIALSVSGLPFHGPVGGVRLTKQKPEDEIICQATYEKREGAYLDAFFSGTKDAINMIELNAFEAQEHEVYELSTMAHTQIQQLLRWQEKIIAQCTPATPVPIAEQKDTTELEQLVENFSQTKLEQALFSPQQEGQNTTIGTIRALELELSEFLTQHGKAELFNEANAVLRHKIKMLIHQQVLQKNRRVDGRKLNEVRPLEIKTGILPRTHGSAIFMRGETHVLSVVTLGAPGEALLQQGMETTGEKRFILHYNFPPYSTGEIGPFRGPGRREIGHGALAERAIAPLIPAQERFPYTIRVVNEVLSSRGSTSMASVCGSSLALMDAGVPIKKHVAGIAMGLMTDEQSNYKILTDIQGPEDQFGDMDFKVAGTQDGITAIQMDVKINGITPAILSEVLAQAKQARLEILDAMIKALPQPKTEVSEYAPKILFTKVPVEKIGEVIGGGGKTIQAIIRHTETIIDIQEDGTIYVSGANKESVQQALEAIQALVKEFKPGEVVNGTVTKFLDFGVLVSIGPRREGLLHISELTPYGVNSPDQLLKLNQNIQVRVSEVLPDGKIRLSLHNVENPSFLNRLPKPGYSRQRKQRSPQQRPNRYPFNKKNNA